MHQNAPLLPLTVTINWFKKWLDYAKNRLTVSLGTIDVLLRLITRFSCCELQHYSFLSSSYNRPYIDENLSQSLVIGRKTPDFNRNIGDFAILHTFYCSYRFAFTTSWFPVAATVDSV